MLYAFDASAYVTENGTYSLGFANSYPSCSYVWSRDSSNPPVLEMTRGP